MRHERVGEKERKRDETWNALGPDMVYVRRKKGEEGRPNVIPSHLNIYCFHYFSTLSLPLMKFSIVFLSIFLMSSLLFSLYIYPISPHPKHQYHVGGLEE